MKKRPAHTWTESTVIPRAGGAKGEALSFRVCDAGFCHQRCSMDGTEIELLVRDLEYGEKPGVKLEEFGEGRDKA